MEKTSRLSFYTFLLTAIVAIASIQTCNLLRENDGLCGVQPSKLRDDIATFSSKESGTSATLAQFEAKISDDTFSWNLNLESGKNKVDALVAGTYLMNALTHALISILIQFVISYTLQLPKFFAVQLAIAYAVHPFLYPPTVYNLVDRGDILGILMNLLAVALYLRTRRYSTGFFRVAATAGFVLLGYQWNPISAALIPLLLLIDFLRSVTSFMNFFGFIVRSIQLLGYSQLYLVFGGNVKASTLSIPYKTIATPFKLPVVPFDKYLESLSAEVSPYLNEAQKAASQYTIQANEYVKPHIDKFEAYLSQFPVLKPYLGTVNIPLTLLLITGTVLLLSTLVVVRCTTKRK